MITKPKAILRPKKTAVIRKIKTRIINTTTKISSPEILHTQPNCQMNQKTIRPHLI